MLLILAVSAATLMTILFSLLKNAGKKDEIAELMAEEEELEPEAPKGKVTGGDNADAAPWEKDADWWQKS
jgi:hypothetical protein